MAMIKHAVVIAGGGPAGLMLAGELALAGVDVAIVELRTALDGQQAGNQIQISQRSMQRSRFGAG